MSKLIAVYPGSFDPPTYGHLDIIHRSLPYFSTLYILVANNINKKTLFTAEERVELIKQLTVDEKKLVVSSFDGLLVDFAKNIKATAIVRGLRAVSDFDYEFQMATLNRRLAPEIETIFFTTRGKYFYINSSTIKDVATYGGDISQFVPSIVEEALIKRLRS